MATPNDKEFERHFTRGTAKMVHDFETDCNNNQKKRTMSGNHNNKLHKTKKKKKSSSTVDENSEFWLDAIK